MKTRQTLLAGRKLQHESLENRICLTASMGWDGPGQGSATLTYTVGDAPAAVGQASFELAIETALDAWADVADIEFVETDQVGLGDSIDFSFGVIDGGGGVLAQAYLPDDVNRARLAGDVEFDSSESWEIGNARGSRATDLVWVAVHEVGHALGLEHEHDHDHVEGAVMAASVSPNTVFRELDHADIDAILELYAPANSTSSSSADTQVADSGLVNVPTTNPVAPNTSFDSPVDQPADDVDDNNVGNDDTTDESPKRRSPWGRGRGFYRWTWFSGFRSGRGRFNVPDVAANDASSGEADDASDLNGKIGWRTSSFWIRPGFRIRIWWR